MTEQEPIRVLLADDHAVVQAGLAALINAEPDMTIVGRARDGLEAVSLYRALSPDVLLLGLRMPKLDGLGVIKELFAIDRRVKVLVLTMFDGDQDIVRPLEAGAKGYLLMDTLPDQVLDAVRAVHAGKSVVPPEVAARVAEHLSSESLTQRELDVLRSIVGGRANKEIAYELDVSEGTVKTHVCNLLQKLRCGSRAEAVAVAIRRGFLRL